jgi:hypothetical protein
MAIRVPESPRFLLARGKLAECEAAVREMARINGTVAAVPVSFTLRPAARRGRMRVTPDADAGLLSAVGLREPAPVVPVAVGEEASSSASADGPTTTFRELAGLILSSRAALSRMVVAGCVWTFLTLGYHGVSIWLPTHVSRLGLEENDRFLDLVLVGVSEIPGFFLVAWLLARIQRGNWSERARASDARDPVPGEKHQPSPRDDVDASDERAPAANDVRAFRPGSATGVSRVGMLLSASLLCCAVSGAGIALATDRPSVIASSCCLYFFVVMAWAIVYVHTPTIFPTEIRGTASAIVGMGATAAGMVAGPLGGTLASVHIGSSSSSSSSDPAAGEDRQDWIAPAFFAASILVAAVAALFIADDHGRVCDTMAEFVERENRGRQRPHRGITPSDFDPEERKPLLADH